jgi:hypothetical protein
MLMANQFDKAIFGAHFGSGEAGGSMCVSCVSAFWHLVYLAVYLVWLVVVRVFTWIFSNKPSHSSSF